MLLRKTASVVERAEPGLDKRLIPEKPRLDESGLMGLTSGMKTVNVHEAKTGFSGLLAEIERKRSRIVICRNGKPIADLVPHQTDVSMDPDKILGAIRIRYDPTEEAREEDWPVELR
jgi:antitoxin (DNA-binding transcriptional repressor) of toxin-antitoxin stability system